MFEVTQSYLKLIFNYREDGSLVYKYSGKIAGWQQFNGYVAASIDNKKYYVHRLIWLWHYGGLPEQIDHINGDPTDNRIENLRSATPSQQIGNANHGPQRGVRKIGNRYYARIMVEYREISLGGYATFEEAKAAYNTAADKYFGAYAYENRP